MNGPNFQLYAANGKLAPITGEVEAGDIDPANYSEALNDLYTYDGTQYGVPKDFDTIGVWVNKALFEQGRRRRCPSAGLDLGRLPADRRGASPRSCKAEGRLRRGRRHGRPDDVLQHDPPGRRDRSSRSRRQEVRATTTRSLRGRACSSGPT